MGAVRSNRSNRSKGDNFLGFGGSDALGNGPSRLEDGRLLGAEVQEREVCTERCENLVQQLRDSGGRADALEEIMRDAGLSGAVGRPCGSGPVLMVFYTDLEPTAAMAIAQLWQLKMESDGMVGQPLIIQHANFDSKDTGRVFEIKQLAARMILGSVETHILTHEGDQGGARVHGDTVHPLAELYMLSREQTITGICEKLVSFLGHRIDWYISSPGSGNLAAIVEKLEEMGAWPLGPKQRVSVYSGAFNMRGMHKGDFKALEKLQGRSVEPLVDVSHAAMFDGRNCRPCTQSLVSFASPDFAEKLTQQSLMLDACLRLYHHDFNKQFLHPDAKALFDHAALGDEDRNRFARIRSLFFTEGSQDQMVVYGKALFDDKALFDKLVSGKKPLVQAFAHDEWDGPLYEQLFFLYEFFRPEEPSKFVCAEGTWRFDATLGATVVDAGRKGAIAALKPALQVPRDEANLKRMSRTMEVYLFNHLNEVAEQNKKGVAGNLVFTATQDALERAGYIVRRMRKGEAIGAVFRDMGMFRKESPPTVGKDRLMVVYTDLEPEAAMAIGQLWKYKVEYEGLDGDPIIVQHVNFDSKDKGTVLEKKRLAAWLMLGSVPIYVLTHEGDQGGATIHGEPPHPQAAPLHKDRDRTIDEICDKLVSFKGSCIEWYIASPGAGNLGAIMERLKRRGRWPLQSTQRITLHSSSFNIRGMHASDVRALEEIIGSSDVPVTDINNYKFFGGLDHHPWTESLTTFAPPCFAEDLSNTAPLLVATFKLFNDEFNKPLISPDCEALFEGVLHNEELRRFSRLKAFFGHGDSRHLQRYARALIEDDELFAKVDSFRKNILRAFAHGGCDAPLGDQLFFFYEWLRRERPEALLVTEGHWSCHQLRGFTELSPHTTPMTTEPLDAVQPHLRNPRDEVILAELQSAMREYFEKQLDSIGVGG